MRPWQHARSSAGKGGDWAADLPLHEFVDSTKIACPDLRHRLVLHNADLGPALAAAAFPGRADAAALVHRHVVQDLGFAPPLAQWLDHCDPERLPRPLLRRLPPSPDALAQRLAAAQGLADDDGPRQVIDLLFRPVALAGPGALGVLCNGMGPALVRAVLGPPRLVSGRGAAPATFDPGHAAEAAIHWLFGTIPPLRDVTAALRRTPAPARRQRHG